MNKPANAGETTTIMVSSLGQMIIWARHGASVNRSIATACKRCEKQNVVHSFHIEDMTLFSRDLYNLAVWRGLPPVSM